jgi:hypothetical protein
MSDGYAFVPLPTTVNRRKRQSLRLDRRLPGHLFGSITVTFKCAQPVHVGSGFKALVNGEVVRSMATRGETLVIPGSTLKGALRARFEAITQSCVPHGLPGNRGHQKNDKGLSRTHPGVTEAELDVGLKGHAAFQGGCSREAACAACALFGFQSGRAGMRARVTFMDLVPMTGNPRAVESIPTQWGPRLHHCAPRDGYHVSGTKIVIRSLKGRKFHLGQGPAGEGSTTLIEVLPAGSMVRAEIRLFNVEKPELGGLLCALGFDHGHALKVGAGKGLGFGRLLPQEISWALRDERGLPMQQEPPRYVEAFANSADRHAVGAAELIRLHLQKDA